MKILIVSAIKEEVASLSDDFEVTLTGVGKINAAIYPTNCVAITSIA